MYFARKAERRGSKLTWERDRELAYNAHRRNLKNMKSSLSIEPPRQFAHLKRNLKKEQMLEGKCHLLLSIARYAGQYLKWTC